MKDGFESPVTESFCLVNNCTGNILLHQTAQIVAILSTLHVFLMTNKIMMWTVSGAEMCYFYISLYTVVLECIVVRCLVYIVVVVCIVVSLCVFAVLLVYSCFLLYMPDCWLEVSIRKVLRPATSAQVFLVFPVSISKCWDGSQDSKLPLHASHVALPT